LSDNRQNKLAVARPDNILLIIDKTTRLLLAFKVTLKYNKVTFITINNCEI